MITTEKTAVKVTLSTEELTLLRQAKSILDEFISLTDQTPADEAEKYLDEFLNETLENGSYSYTE